MTASERATLVQALVLVPAMHLSVRVLGFSRLQQRIANTAPRAVPVAPIDAVRTCVVSVNRVKCYSWFKGNCLSQSLALAWLLHRRGIRPELRLGARLTGTTFDAHAWVEFDGRVLNDTPDVGARYPPLTTPRPDRRPSY